MVSVWLCFDYCGLHLPVDAALFWQAVSHLLSTHVHIDRHSSSSRSLMRTFFRVLEPPWKRPATVKPGATQASFRRHQAVPLTWSVGVPSGDGVISPNLHRQPPSARARRHPRRRRVRRCPRCRCAQSSRSVVSQASQLVVCVVCWCRAPCARAVCCAW